ncbi:DUF6481 family protein [Pelagibacterium limicola]|nr:DUF6481 family protein [Pelagibacterium limicola]
MKPPRNDDYAERRQSAYDAKKALLDKLKTGKKAGAVKSGAKSDTSKKV